MIDEVVLHVIYCSQCRKTTLNSVIRNVNVRYDVYYGVFVCVRGRDSIAVPLKRICNGIVYVNADFGKLENVVLSW